jgi:hypothetical protein
MSLKFELALCELFHPKIHGIPETSEICVLSHYLLLLSFSPPTETQTWTQIWNEIKACTLLHQKKYLALGGAFLENHDVFQNYSHMTLQKNIPSVVCPHIVQRVQMGEYVVAVIKTFWIRWIQRVWKRVFRERRAWVQRLSFLKARENQGKVVHLPSLRGMLFRS